jgi:threonine dehydratase
MPSSTLSEMTGTDLYLKAENLQKTGSFKPRGALTAVSKLSPADRARGVITMSAGNMGQGLAFAARQFGCPCTVVIRSDATKSKIEALRGYGAQVVLAPISQWRQRLDEEQQRRQQVFVHPFGTPEVVAGQGTLGLELLEELSDVSTIVVPVGGGGLISGVAAAVKQQRPQVRVVGVEPEGSAVVQLSLQKGSPQPLDRLDTIADGLAAPWTEEYNLAIIRQHVDEMVSVSDREIALALVTILERMKLLVEPAGAAAVAALLTRKVNLGGSRKTIAILSGGNADADKLKQAFSLVSGSS